MINLSILIVHYHVKEKLFVCIKSILDSNPKNSFEILVIDNDERKTINKELKKKFPKVKYIKSTKNIGYGGGVNLGVKHASGSYLFILNPDTIVFPNTIDILISFLKKNKKVGIVAPNLYDKNENIFPKQGFGLLTPFRALFALSFLNKLFPNNPVSRAYWRANENKNKVRYVDAIPGTAFMIRKSLFEKIEGFDEKFFLFFEEFDLCNRVIKEGNKLAMIPKTKVVHFWGESTKQKSEISKLFITSRFYYFKKNFGLIKAITVEAFLRIGKNSLLLFLILIISAFLRLYHLSETMPFYGDVGWFYLSARDILLTHNIPLVGITSSHIWLHQGALWTYILAILLSVSKFNPIIGVYFIAILGIITTFLVYKISGELLSKRIGLIASFLYATSPIVVQDSRLSYHTSPIPFVTILLIFFVIKLVKGNKYFFPLITFTLGILYNFEIATFSLFGTFLLILSYGILRKKSWAKKIINKKIIILSLISFLIPMLPMLIYDINHGFPQTLKFIVWLFYRIAVFFGYPPLHPNSPGETWATFFPYLSNGIRNLIFIKSKTLSIFILLASSVFVLKNSILTWKNKKEISAEQIIFIFFLIPSLGYIAAKTNSSAYFLMFYPQVIIVIAVFIDYLMNKKHLFLLILMSLLLICFSNIYLLLVNDYYKGHTYPKYLEAAKFIVRDAKGKEYNIIGKGNSAKYESSITPFKYLTWYLGHRASEKNEKLKFYITEYTDRIKIEGK